MRGTLEQRIRAVFGLDAADALRIATLASGLDPRAVNRDQNRVLRGLFQIPSTFDGRQYPVADVPRLLEADYNIEVAKRLFDKRGWTWSAAARTLGLDVTELDGPGEGEQAAAPAPVTTEFPGSTLTSLIGTADRNPALVDPTGWKRKGRFRWQTVQPAWSPTLALWAIGGLDGSIWTSPSLEGPWTSRASGLDGFITGMAWGRLGTANANYGFVAMDDRCGVAWSTDGATWEYLPNQVGLRWPTYQDVLNDAAWDGGAAFTAFTTDGNGTWSMFITWPNDSWRCWPVYTTDITDPFGLKGTGYLYADTNTYYSYDLFNGGSAWAATYANGYFVAVGDHGCLAYSTNGSYWYRNTNPGYAVETATSYLIDNYDVQLNAVAWDGSQWLLGGTGGRVIYASSPSAGTWSSSLAFSDQTDITGIASGGSRVVVVGDSYDATKSVQPYGGTTYPSSRLATAATASGPWTEVEEGHGAKPNYWVAYRGGTWAVSGGAAGYLATATDPTKANGSTSTATGAVLLNQRGDAVRTGRTNREAGSTSVQFSGYRAPNADDAAVLGYPVLRFTAVRDSDDAVVASATATVSNQSEQVLATLTYTSEGGTTHHYEIEWTGGSQGGAVAVPEGQEQGPTDGIAYGGHKPVITKVVEVR